MKKRTKLNLCIALLVIGLLSFTLQVFVFSAPDGFFGFLLCLTSIYFMMGSIYKLCKLSPKFKKAFFEFLDLLFFIG